MSFNIQQKLLLKQILFRIFSYILMFSLVIYFFIIFFNIRKVLNLGFGFVGFSFFDLIIYIFLFLFLFFCFFLPGIKLNKRSKEDYYNVINGKYIYLRINDLKVNSFEKKEKIFFQFVLFLEDGTILKDKSFSENKYTLDSHNIVKCFRCVERGKIRLFLEN